MTKIAIVVYSTWGHVLALAKSELEGAKSVAGVTVDLLQIPSDGESDASANAGIPLATPEVLENYDGFLFGVPTRFGQIPAQFKAFFDATGGQWAKGAYSGKFGGFFVTTGTPGGGQETTARNTISLLVHHGIIFVPLGYAPAFADLTNLDEVHGGSPWGAGGFAGPSGERSISPLEHKIAKTQGAYFAQTVARGTGNLKSAGAAGATGAGAAGAAGAGAAGAGAAGAGAAGAGASGAAGATGASSKAAAPTSASAPPTGAPKATGSSAPTDSGAHAPAGQSKQASTQAQAQTQTPESSVPAKESANPEKVEKAVEEEKKQCCGICTIM